jgi:hypothetical protein
VEFLVFSILLMVSVHLSAARVSVITTQAARAWQATTEGAASGLSHNAVVDGLTPQWAKVLSGATYPVAIAVAWLTYQHLGWFGVIAVGLWTLLGPSTLGAAWPFPSRAQFLRSAAAAARTGSSQNLDLAQLLETMAEAASAEPPATKDLLRAEIALAYDTGPMGEDGKPVGAHVTWTELSAYPSLPGNRARIALALLHLAHILRITRDDRQIHDGLFETVLRSLREEANAAHELAFPAWRIQVAGMGFLVWPWPLLPASPTKSKTYVATLKLERSGTFGLHLKMPFGQERVATPGSALVLLASLSHELDEQDRGLLAEALRTGLVQLHSTGPTLWNEEEGLQAALRVITVPSQQAEVVAAQPQQAASWSEPEVSAELAPAPIHTTTLVQSRVHPSEVGNRAAHSQEPALALIDHVFSEMRIDPEWSLRQARGFEWWGHQLRQRVWAEPMRDSSGWQVAAVHAETDLLRDVAVDQDLVQRLCAVNTMADLSALVLDVPQQRVFYHCSAYVHEQNLVWLKHLFTNAVAIQAAEAQIRAETFAHVLGGVPAFSAHPLNGTRTEPDDMLNVIRDAFLPFGHKAPKFGKSDIDAVLALEPQPWVLASGDAHGLTAEFAFAEEDSAPLSGDTALLRLMFEQTHPTLSTGTLLLLNLPIPSDAKTICRLNLAEAREWTGTHFLGAWCENPQTLTITFTTFLPSAAYVPGLLVPVVQAAARRCIWTREYFERESQHTLDILK